MVYGQIVINYGKGVRVKTTESESGKIVPKQNSSKKGIFSKID
jgi:hypothetical protein